MSRFNLKVAREDRGQGPLVLMVVFYASLYMECGPLGGVEEVKPMPAEKLGPDLKNIFSLLQTTLLQNY